MKTTVPPTAVDRDRTSKPAAKLQPGDWLSADHTTFNCDLDYVTGQVEVLSVHPYDGNWALVVVRAPGDPSPMVQRWRADLEVHLATPQELELASTCKRWNEVADALVRVADGLRTMKVGRPSLQLTIMPAGWDTTDAEKVAAVEAVCQAIFGKPGETRENANDHRQYHQAHNDIGALYVSVHEQLSAEARPAEPTVGNAAAA